MSQRCARRGWLRAGGVRGRAGLTGAPGRGECYPTPTAFSPYSPKPSVYIDSDDVSKHSLAPYNAYGLLNQLYRLFPVPVKLEYVF